MSATHDVVPGNVALRNSHSVYSQATVDDLKALEKDAERWRKNIEMIRRKHGNGVTEEVIAAVDAAITATKAGIAATKVACTTTAK